MEVNETEYQNIVIVMKRGCSTELLVRHPLIRMISLTESDDVCIDGYLPGNHRNGKDFVYGKRKEDSFLLSELRL